LISLTEDSVSISNGEDNDASAKVAVLTHPDPFRWGSTEIESNYFSFEERPTDQTSLKLGHTGSVTSCATLTSPLIELEGAHIKLIQGGDCSVELSTDGAVVKSPKIEIDAASSKLTWTKPTDGRGTISFDGDVKFGRFKLFNTTCFFDPQTINMRNPTIYIYQNLDMPHFRIGPEVMYGDLRIQSSFPRVDGEDGLGYSDAVLIRAATDRRVAEIELRADNAAQNFLTTLKLGKEDVRTEATYTQSDQKVLKTTVTQIFSGIIQRADGFDTMVSPAKEIYSQVVVQPQSVTIDTPVTKVRSQADMVFTTGTSVDWSFDGQWAVYARAPAGESSNIQMAMNSKGFNLNAQGGSQIKLDGPVLINGKEVGAGVTLEQFNTYMQDLCKQNSLHYPGPITV
jgi:hypothetical protein